METPRTWWSIRFSDFGFESDYPSQINRPQCPTVLYTVYRIAIFLYFESYLVYEMVTTIDGFDGVRTFIFLSTWGYMIVNVYIALAFFNTTVDVCTGGRPIAMPLRHKFQWFFFNVSINGSLVICFFFWTIYGRDPLVRAFFPSMMRNVNIHLIPAVVTVFDLLSTAVPFRFVHFVYPLAFGVVYTIFSVVYWRAGGTNPWGFHFIYPMLDYGDDPSSAVGLVFGLFAGVVGIHAVLKGIYLAREWVVAKLNLSWQETSTEHIPLTGSTTDTTNHR